MLFSQELDLIHLFINQLKVDSMLFLLMLLDSPRLRIKDLVIILRGLE